MLLLIICLQHRQKFMERISISGCTRPSSPPIDSDVKAAQPGTCTLTWLFNLHMQISPAFDSSKECTEQVKRPIDVGSLFQSKHFNRRKKKLPFPPALTLKSRRINYQMIAGIFMDLRPHPSIQKSILIFSNLRFQLEIFCK